MNPEKYTERARGFIQSAQTGALGRGPPAVHARAHLLKVLLDDPEGPRGRADRARRRRTRDGACRRPSRRSTAMPKVSGRRRPALSRPADREGLRHRREDRQEGRRLLRHRRAAAAGAGHGEGRQDREDPRRRRRHAADAQRRDRGDPQGPHRRFRLGREPVRRAEEIRPRPHRRSPRGQARPGHRPRRGNPPHHPGALPPHQEQPGADRRARRRQDRDRRGPRAPHRQWRRAGEPEGQAAAGARHGRADRRREISRRVRGAAEGRAHRGHSRPRARSSCSSTRCTRWSAPARRTARWTPRTC